MSTITTPAEMRELLGKTTPGKWKAERLGGTIREVMCVKPEGRETCICGIDHVDDYRFIAAAHNSMSHYLDRIEEMEKALQKLTADLGSVKPALKAEQRKHAKARQRIHALERAVAWALGESPGGLPAGTPEFLRPEGEHRPYWWRTTLRALSRSALPPVEKPEGKDE